jgi:hypothetical protein
MDKIAKAVIGGITTGGAAFLASYGVRPLPAVVVLTVVSAASGFGLVWGVPNGAAKAP